LNLFKNTSNRRCYDAAVRICLRAVLTAAAFVLLIGASNVAGAQSQGSQGVMLGSETAFRYSGWPSFYCGTISRTVISEDLFTGNEPCEGCSLRFQASFRLEGDPSICEADSNLFPALKQISPMLQYAYVAWRPISFIELKAGRMLSYDPDAYMAMDGVTLRFIFLKGVGVEGSFGMAVRDTWPTGYQGPAFQGPVDDQPPMTLVKAALFAEGAEGVAAKIQYRRAFDGQVEREDVGGALTVNVLKYMTLGLAIEYSILLDQIDYAQADVIVPAGDFTVKAAYTRKVPVFVGSSIFNYFSIYPYDEGKFALTWASGAFKSVGASYSFRFLHSGTKLAFDNVAEAWIKARLAPKVDGGLQLSYAEGDGGRRGGASAEVDYYAYRWLQFKFEAGGSKFGDDLQTAFDGWAAFGGAGAEIALGYGTALALDVDGYWDTLYGWRLYGTATFRAVFDFKR
jgi:hypothetical protein